VSLAADCGRCVGLCCVAPAFVASADFAFSKPAGVACRHLDADARCSIHDRLIPSGFAGCVAYDCFGAGQRTVALFSRPDGRGPGGGRSARMLPTYEVVQQLHELLWYLTDALSRPAAAPVHGALAAARASIDAAVDAGPDALDSTDPAAHRAAVAPLLRRASTLVRTAPPDPADRNVAGRDLAGRSVAGRDRAARDPGGRDLAGRERAGRDLAGRDLAGRDLAGRDLAGADLWRADLSTATLIGADLRDADLRSADLLGADLRGARLAGADLTGALYLTRTQVGGAQGSPGTRLPDRLPPPAHWR
jgi:hypothetical protein